MAFALIGTFDATELLELRRGYTRDLYVASPEEYLSGFNQHERKNWADDDTVNAILTRVENDYSREIEAVYDEKYYDRLDAGDSESDADTAALLLAKHVTYRLVRSELWRMMIQDSGYRARVGEGAEAAEVLQSMREQINSDLAFIRSRASAPRRMPMIQRQ